MNCYYQSFLCGVVVSLCGVSASPLRESDLWSVKALPEQVAVPAVAGDRWVVNPVDNFILSKLFERGLHPTREEADRYTLIRRLSLGLTGLPPSVPDIRQFVDDESEFCHVYSQSFDS